jgi:hypothetical protein
MYIGIGGGVLGLLCFFSSSPSLVFSRRTGAPPSQPMGSSL